MNDLVVDRDIAAPAAPFSRHIDAPRWWTEWIAQVLAAGPSPEAARVSTPVARPMRDATCAPDAVFSAARALRDAVRALREAEARAEDDLSLAIARHQWHLARRAWQARLEEAAGPGAHWCLCSLESATAH